MENSVWEGASRSCFMKRGRHYKSRKLGISNSRVPSSNRIELGMPHVKEASERNNNAALEYHLKARQIHAPHQRSSWFVQDTSLAVDFSKSLVPSARTIKPFLSYFKIISFRFTSRATCLRREAFNFLDLKQESSSNLGYSISSYTVTTTCNSWFFVARSIVAIFVTLFLLLLILLMIHPTLVSCLARTNGPTLSCVK